MSSPPLCAIALTLHCRLISSLSLISPLAPSTVKFCHLFLQASAVALMEFSKAMLQTSRNVSLGLFCSCQFEFAMCWLLYYIFFSPLVLKPLNNGWF